MPKLTADHIHSANLIALPGAESHKDWCKKMAEQLNKLPDSRWTEELALLVAKVAVMETIKGLNGSISDLHMRRLAEEAVAKVQASIIGL